jgi:hypothetical protein
VPVEQAMLGALHGPGYVIFLTPDWDHEVPETPEVAQHAISMVREWEPQLHGTIGAAILRREYAAMREVWASQAHTWGCGRQDHYGELMDATAAAIRDCGYHGPLEPRR